ncbi:MAG TPA: hypothetical protein VFO52_11750 [Longimicrobiales bacterium]|nr:hypothetical protein [Longimicrobiales bacterium]
MLATALLAALLQASPAPSPDQQLIDAARRASATFKQRSAAIRAGYRRLGPEIPEMGEHWINPIMIVEARFDPARPPMLTYATINGQPTLTGVGYALALRPGESPPPTGVSGTWHDHTATVAAELATGDHAKRAGGARVVVLHAWVWLDNPAGVFADENWALPYVRLGRQPPGQIDPLAARAVALQFDGVSYYANVLRSMTGMDFRAELEQAAHQVAGSDDQRAVWMDLVARITMGVTDAAMKAKLRRALGVSMHDH